jgi:hypothetical protein
MIALKILIFYNLCLVFRLNFSSFLADIPPSGAHRMRIQCGSGSETLVWSLHFLRRWSWAVLRIRDVFSRIPDPDPTITPSRIRIPGVKKHRIPDPTIAPSRIPDPGCKKAPDPGSGKLILRLKIQAWRWTKKRPNDPRPATGQIIMYQWPEVPADGGFAT